MTIVTIGRTAVSEVICGGFSSLRTEDGSIMPDFRQGASYDGRRYSGLGDQPPSCRALTIESTIDVETVYSPS